MNLIGKLNYILELFLTYKDWYRVLIARFFQTTPQLVHLRNGLIITGGEHSLIPDLVDEIFIKEVYNPEFLKIEPGETVIDIGANIGVFSLYALKKGAVKVYSVEPLPDNTRFIKQNFKVNQIDKQFVVEKAISDKNGKAKFYLGDLDSHGLLFNHNRITQFKKYVLVDTIKLETLFKQNKIREADFLKMDCEGSEGQIILSTSKNIWSRIKKIAIEYHDNVSALSHDEILNKLQRLGYKTFLRKNDVYFGYIYAKRI